ncbi:GSCFA domain-containing protein [Flavobacterium sp. F-380]|uniref:GSCFA domain-containing protein n=1 Tax=Flavobacterium kayseriense TaxID=2764714 RepID=A0ABR7J311_9FLAO|nr:GSCFA domain-containing protein [Flavobacterium kayseriense]MBC5839913.1 GSCFA domain-containing protein [Flavobacterium kayseriense]MBC5847417.1 GSCFA domain-containing protein [Flavobacterium kayseriense]MBU0940117.1 GSCFA domain-containing protein [Bacteroidota bacterium]
MQFRTQIPISQSNHLIDYNVKMVSLGSCFAENMSAKLDYYQFQNYCNPFGIIFNPSSIEKLIDRITTKKYYTEKDIFFYNEHWHCFELHSQFSNPNKELFLISINGLIDVTRQKIEQASQIIITYGTAWIYRSRESMEIVANCHKVPQKEFDKELLSVALIQESITNTIELIRSINPSASFIFTISPVRHIKDGFVQNQLSKSHLFSALHDVLQKKNDGVSYFPSYEIMMDELRDYRFYTEDMLHPNQVAIDYIWERFVDTAISAHSKETMIEIDSIQKSLQHRSFNPSSDSHQKFEIKLQAKIAKMVSQYSFMKF